MMSPRNLWRILRREILKAAGNIAGREPFSTPARCLIIAPHPDDEVLGCGGFLAGHAMEGNRVDILFLTEGEAAHGGCCPTPASEVGANRRRLAAVANETLGVPRECLHFLEGRDGHLPRPRQADFTTLAGKIAACLEKSVPEAVFCPHPFEGWSDHVAAGELTRSALAMLAPNPMPRLYHYCVWFWYNMPLVRARHIDWRRARLLDIAAQHSLKQQAIRIYLDALVPCGYPWVGKLPPSFLRAFDWERELFFEADISSPQKRHS